MANGYKNSLSTIEEWLGDSRSNVRRAVSETGRFTIPMLLYCRRAGSSGKYRETAFQLHQVSTVSKQGAKHCNQCRFYVLCFFCHDDKQQRFCHIGIAFMHKRHAVAYNQYGQCRYFTESRAVQSDFATIKPIEQND